MYYELVLNMSFNDEIRTNLFNLCDSFSVTAKICQLYERRDVQSLQLQDISFSMLYVLHFPTYTPPRCHGSRIYLHPDKPLSPRRIMNQAVNPHSFL